MVKIAPAAAIDKSSSRARNCSYAFNVAPGQKSRRNQGLAALPARQITHNQPGAPAIHDCSASCGIVAEVRLLYILFSPGVLYLELDASSNYLYIAIAIVIVELCYRRTGVASRCRGNEMPTKSGKRFLDERNREGQPQCLLKIIWYSLHQLSKKTL